MSFSATVPVEIPGARYDITIEFDLLRRAGEVLKALTGATKAAVVTDSHVGPLHVGILQQSLESAGIEAILATIPAGEEHKTIDRILPVYDTLLRARIDRGTPVVYAPPLWALIMFVIRLLPRFVMRRVSF